MASQLPPGGSTGGAPPAAGAHPQLPASLLFDGGLPPPVDGDGAGGLYAAAGVAPVAGPFGAPDAAGLLAPPSAAAAAAAAAVAAAAAAARAPYLPAGPAGALPLPPAAYLPPPGLGSVAAGLPGLRFPPGSIRTNPAPGRGGRGKGPGGAASASDAGSGAASDSPCGAGGTGSESGGSTPVKKTRRGCRGGRQKRWYVAQQMAAAAAISGAPGVSSYEVFRVLSGAAAAAAAAPGALQHPAARYPGSL
jgi:hypothetical protein